MIRSHMLILLTALAVFALAYPFSVLLPAWTSWENGPIERLQVLAYAAGLVHAGVMAQRSDGSWKALWLAVMPIWFLLAMREMSWGAVFYDPLGYDSHGPVYSARKTLWYYAAVGPIAGCLLLLGLVSAVIGKVWQLIPTVRSSGSFPWFECLMAGICVLLMTATEHHMGMSLDFPLGEGQIFEEMVELAAGLFLLTAQQKIRMAQAPSQRAAAEDRYHPAWPERPGR